MSHAPRVLVVDDDDDYADSVTALLAAHGFDVLRARDGRDGLRLARTARPDLVLLDVMMDERTEGFFTLQELRRDPDIAATPVFVVSSIYADLPGFRVRPEAGWLRHDGFFPKPLDFDRLLDAIRERLAPAPTGVA